MLRLFDYQFEFFATQYAKLMSTFGLPSKQGLYDPAHEHDACGMGFVVDLKNRKSHDIIQQALQILVKLEHRGACGCEKNTGDGAGIVIQMPHDFLKRECEKRGIDLPLPGRYGGCAVGIGPGGHGIDQRRHGPQAAV